MNLFELITAVIVRGIESYSPLISSALTAILISATTLIRSALF